MSLFVSPQRFKDFQGNYLDNPVLLVPCGHKVNKIYAESSYGKMDNDACTIQDQICPELHCGRVITKYYEDPEFGAIVKQLLFEKGGYALSRQTFQFYSSLRQLGKDFRFWKLDKMRRIC